MFRLPGWIAALVLGAALTVPGSASALIANYWTDGVPTGSWQYYGPFYQMDADTSLRVFVYSRNGSNPDVYVRTNQKPTTWAYSCKSNQAGTATESCEMNPIGVGQTYWVGVRMADQGSSATDNFGIYTLFSHHKSFQGYLTAAGQEIVYGPFYSTSSSIYFHLAEMAGGGADLYVFKTGTKSGNSVTWNYNGLPTGVMWSTSSSYNAYNCKPSKWFTLDEKCKMYGQNVYYAVVRAAYIDPNRGYLNFRFNAPTSSDWGGDGSLVYRDWRTYQVEHTIDHDVVSGGGSASSMLFELLIPAPKQWSEQTAPSNETATLFDRWGSFYYTVGSLATGHYSSDDTDYLYYWWQYDARDVPDRLVYQYDISAKKTIFTGLPNKTLDQVYSYAVTHGLSEHLIDSTHLETNHSVIQDLKDDILSDAGINPNSGNAYQAMRAFYDYIYDNARYNSTASYSWGGTVNFKYRTWFYEGGTWIRRHYGQCGDYSALFIALCRAAGIPSRPVVGYWHGGTDSHHVWAESYIQGAGWLPVDVTVDQGNPAARYQRFGRLHDGNRRLAVSKDHDFWVSQWHSPGEVGLLQLPAMAHWWTRGQPIWDITGISSSLTSTEL